MKKYVIYMHILILALLLKTQTNAQIAIINEPVVDLREKPIDSPANLQAKLVLSKNNPLQDTQLLLNEKIEILEEEEGEWIKIFALEQPKYNFANQKWGYHCGWIKKNAATLVDHFTEYNLVVKKSWAPIITNHSNETLYVSIGTKLTGEKINADTYSVNLPDGSTRTISTSEVNKLNTKFSTTDLRKNLNSTSKQFLNTPYSWGGRSGFNSYMPFQTGVDCSALVNLIYGVNGIKIPRDARHQFKACTPINSNSLQCGDLIFLADKTSSSFANPEKINHIMMYLGESIILESTGKAPFFKTHMISAKEKLGKDLNEINSTDTCEQYYVFFGTFLD